MPLFPMMVKIKKIPAMPSKSASASSQIFVFIAVSATWTNL